MNQLTLNSETNQLFNINYNDENLTVSARDLYKELNITDRFNRWFERMCEYGFVEDIDFTSVKSFTLVNNGAEREIQDYKINIDMAKEIAMLQRNEKGKEIRRKLIELEKAWNTPELVMMRGLQASKKVIADLNNKLLKVKPKVDFYDSVADSKTAIPMDQVAKVLSIRGVGRNKLFELLRNMNILQKNNIPYQEYVDRGYFRVVETKYTKPNGETCISIKTLVYQKGVDYIRKKLEGVKNDETKL